MRTQAHAYILTNGGSQVSESLVKRFLQKVHIVSKFLIHCCWQYTKMLPRIGAQHRGTEKNNEWEDPEGPHIFQRESNTLRLRENLPIKSMMDKIPEMYIYKDLKNNQIAKILKNENVSNSSRVTVANINVSYKIR